MEIQRLMILILTTLYSYIIYGPAGMDVNEGRWSVLTCEELETRIEEMVVDQKAWASDFDCKMYEPNAVDPEIFDIQPAYESWD
jgi:hypothetical protein